MPVEESRKIIKIGPSALVTLPMTYRRYNHIEASDKVTMIYNGLLLIIPEGMEYVAEEKKDLIEQLLGNRETERTK